MNRRGGRAPERQRESSRECHVPGVDEAFGIWLERRLHELYDEVVREPIPSDLLFLIEAHRARRPEKG
jgi:hypothetical protein